MAKGILQMAERNFVEEKKNNLKIIPIVFRNKFYNSFIFLKDCIIILQYESKKEANSNIETASFLLIIISLWYYLNIIFLVITSLVLILFIVK